MSHPSEQRARRVLPTPQPPSGLERVDYADAFEIRVAAPDARPAQEWVGSALEQSPLLLRWTIRLAHRFVLGFHLAPRNAAGSLMGWRIVTSERDLIHLRASSPLMQGDLVARRGSPLDMVLATYLSFDKPLPARMIWVAVGPVHRRIAPYLLERSAAAGARDPADSA